MFTSHQWRIAAIAATLLLAAAATQAQSITGTVVDPTGAVVPNAAVEIHNPVSRYDRSTTTDASGKFSFQNVPFNPYLGYGGESWGNFLGASGLKSGRFLDPPEFAVMHDKGNEENFFDRVDYKFSNADSILLNLEYTRSWFQNPNSFDQQFHNINNAGVLTDPLTGAPLGLTDQVSQIKTYNIAPTWTHLIGSSTVPAKGQLQPARSPPHRRIPRSEIRRSPRGTSACSTPSSALL